MLNFREGSSLRHEFGVLEKSSHDADRCINMLFMQRSAALIFEVHILAK